MHYNFSFLTSVFFAIARSADPPNTGLVILKGKGVVFSILPKIGSISKKCKKYYAVATLAINKYNPSAGIAPT